MSCPTNRYCWVRYCDNYKRRDPNVHLYPVPYCLEDRAVWSKAFGIPLDTMNDQTMICSAHFVRKNQLLNILNTENYCKIYSNSGSNLDNTITIHAAKDMRRKRHHKRTHESNIPAVSNPLESQISPISNVKTPDPPILHEKPSSIEDVESIEHLPAPLPRISSTSGTLGPLPVVKCNSIDSDETTQSPQIKNLLSCDLFLDCQEEDLSQIQQNFQTEEWLNYCKYNATISDLPSIKAVNGSDVMGGAVIPPELPVLVFSNAPKNTQLSQTVLSTLGSISAVGSVPTIGSVPTVGNVPFVGNVPTTGSVPILGSVPTVGNIPTAGSVPILGSVPTVGNVPIVGSQPTVGNIPVGSQSAIGSMPTVGSIPAVSRNTHILVQVPPVISSNSSLFMHPTFVQSPQTTQPIVPVQLMGSNIFPVKLEKATAENKAVNENKVINENKAINESKAPNNKVYNEEVFPLILQESLSELLHDPTKNGGCSILENSSTKGKIKGVTFIDVEKESTSCPSFESGNSRSMSPDLLNNLEINFQETESDSVAFTKAFGNSSQFLSTEGASDDSNGPRIIDVKSGDDGAKVYYNDKGDLMKVTILEVDPKTKKGKDSAEFSNDSLTAEKNMPKTVTQWSIFSMQKTIAVISTGTREASVNNLLNLRPNFPPPSSDNVGVNLRNRLREENFLTLTGWWLAKKRYVPFQFPCSFCGCKIFLINSNSESPDDLCWTCQSCSRNYPVKRPKLFDRFPHLSLEELLLLTYHWACKSLPYVIKKDVHIHEDIIFNYFSALQEVCGDYISKHCQFGKRATKQTTVEVSAVKLGNFFILCAYCRLTKLTRLKALTTEEACGSIAHIKVLENMLAPYCTVITWKQICDEFLPGIHKVCADPNVHYIHSSQRHILNASKYLGKTLISLFQNINHDTLSLKDVQGYLDELQWRERLGRIEESAFWNIMNEISKMNDTYYTEVVFGDISRDRYFYKQDLSFQMRWGPVHVSPTIAKANPVANPVTNSDENRMKAISQTMKNTSVELQSKSVFLPPAAQAVADQISATKNNIIGKSVLKHPISIGTVEAFRERTFPSTDKITSKDLLSVKIVFDHDKSVIESHYNQSINLGIKLKNEGYIQKPVQWLINRKLINEDAKCYVCRSSAKLVKNSKFPDGVSWLCSRKSCKFENKFKRPAFFAMFGFQMEILFAIVYHWAVQSDYKTLVKAIPVNEFTIICVHRQLQKICANVMRRPCFVLGGKNNVVEVALVKFANCFILGAMERERKFSRFRVFSVTAKLHIDEIRRTLVSWLYWNSTVIVNSNKYFGAYCMEEKINLVFADKGVTDINSKKYHTLTITNYLQTHMKHMFAAVKVEYLSAEVLQIYLDELVWRERYGKSPELAFQNILEDIFVSECKVKDVPAYAPSSSYRPSTSTTFLPHLPEVKVVLKRLPEDVIKKYLYPDKNIDQSLQRKPQQLKKARLSVDLSDRLSHQSESFVNVVKNSIDLGNDKIALVVKDAKIDYSLQNKSSHLKALLSADMNDKLYHQSGSSDLVNDSVVLVNDKLALPTEETQNSDDEVEIITTVECPKEIKVEIISSDDEDVELIKLVQGSEKSLTSLSSSSSIINQNSTETVKQECKHPAVTFPKFPAITDVEVKKKFSDKCYSHKRRHYLEGDSKFQCIECKEIVSEDHFVKTYTCDDCKYNVYNTCCQKAFAEHRSYVLFGRKKSQKSSRESRNYRHNLLSEWWYCSCGFASKEGNKLASHLVKCMKNTCYSNYQEIWLKK